MKPGGPPPKAKYSLATDSEEVRRLKGEKDPFKGSQKNLKPCTYKLSEPYVPIRRETGDGVPFAEWTGELLCTARLSPSGAEPKRKRVRNARLSRAEQTRNLSDLHMARPKGM